MEQHLFTTGAYDHYVYPIRNLYYKKHQKVPNEFSLANCDFVILDEIIKKYKSNIKRTVQSYKLVADKPGIQQPKSYFIELNCKDSYLVLAELFIDENNQTCGSAYLFYDDENDEVCDVIEILKKNAKLTTQKPKIYLVKKTGNGLELEYFTIKSPEIDFDCNYNIDFKETNDLIVERLSQNYSKGLVLLYGLPGTGKTSYLRYLASIIRNKKLIYLPPNMTNILSDPSLISLLTNHPNSILLLEDAENSLMSRGVNSGNDPSVSNILNLSDGLLSDCLTIQIVATFNTKIANIDEALLRKGRLIAKYEFKDLEESQIRNYCEKHSINFDSLISQGKTYTISDLMNISEKDYTKQINKIGFSSN